MCVFINRLTFLTPQCIHKEPIFVNGSESCCVALSAATELRSNLKEKKKKDERVVHGGNIYKRMNVRITIFFFFFFFTLKCRPPCGLSV